MFERDLSDIYAEHNLSILHTTPQFVKRLTTHFQGCENELLALLRRKYENKSQSSYSKRTVEKDSSEEAETTPQPKSRRRMSRAVRSSVAKQQLCNDVANALKEAMSKMRIKRSYTREDSSSLCGGYIYKVGFLSKKLYFDLRLDTLSWYKSEEHLKRRRGFIQMSRFTTLQIQNELDENGQPTSFEIREKASSGKKICLKFTTAREANEWYDAVSAVIYHHLLLSMPSNARSIFSGGDIKKPASNRTLPSQTSCPFPKKCLRGGILTLQND